MDLVEPDELQQLLTRTQTLQQRLAGAFAELTDATVTGSAGNGLVSVTMRGNGELTRISIDPSTVDGGDLRRLEELILSAVRSATDAITQLKEDKARDLTAGLNIRPS